MKSRVNRIMVIVIAGVFSVSAWAGEGGGKRGHGHGRPGVEEQFLWVSARPLTRGVMKGGEE